MLVKIPVTLHVKDAKRSTNHEARDGAIVGVTVATEVPPMTPIDLPDEEAEDLLKAFAHLGAVKVDDKPAAKSAKSDDGEKK
jgi:hypothetical protein